MLVEQGARSALLLLFTARPEFRAQWAPRAHYTQITLGRLSAHNAHTMIGEVAAQKALSEETIAAVVERTGGVPLFVEELTRAVLERGGESANHEIPATLHDSLMARLDRLGPAKDVVQVAAVIGREFSHGLLRAVHPLADADLQSALAKLAEAELVYTRGIAPEATYTFKHALIQDAAYDALLKARRRELHLKVAQTINENFADLADAHPEVLARHWTEAGETEAAIAAWSKAGEAAKARSAFKEAQENYQRAVSLITLLPESPERDSRELDLRQSIVLMLYYTSGYSTPETIDATERAAALAEKTGNLTQLVVSLGSRSGTAFFSGDLAAGRLNDQALEVAIREGSPFSRVFVHLGQLATRYACGDLVGAEQHFIALLKFSDGPDSGRFPFSQTVVTAFAYGSWNAWLLGRADVARERMAQMMARVNRGSPFELVLATYSDASLRLLMREYDRSEVLAARCLELSEKHRFPVFIANARCLLGQARAQLGRPSEGVALLRQGLAGMLEVGQSLGVAFVTTVLAAAQECGGDTDDALETVEQAVQGNSEELLYRPDVLKLRAELLLKRGQTELAEADFRVAIQLSQSMSAKALELRTTMSLARLLRDTRRRDEARAMLTDIYGWFTEGFDTADLIDAKALLEELAR